MTVSSSAERYKSQDDVDTDISLLKSPKAAGCYQTLLKQQLETSLAGATINTVDFAITPKQSGQPDNLVATGAGKITLTANGQASTIYADVAFISGPSIEAELDIESQDQAIPDTLFSSLITAVAGRAAS
jgi:hypothetical protein